MEARAALLAANELLRYSPVDDLYEEWLDLYEEWLDRVAGLVRTAGGSPASSLSLPPPSTSYGRRGSWGASTTSAPRRLLGTKARGSTV